MKNRTSEQVLDELARELTGQDFNLSSGLMAQIRKEEHKKMKRKSLMITAVAVVLGITVLLSIPNAAQAVKRLFGYLPGTGFVEQGVPLRILEQPVKVEIDQSTVILSQAVTDSEHLRLFYQVENIPYSETLNEDKEAYCRALPWVRTADGQRLNAKTVTANFWGSGYYRQLEFSALPADQDSATLVLPCIEGALKADSPADIEVAMHLVAAPEGMTVYPIVELPTPTAKPVEQQDTSLAGQISLTIQKYIQTDDRLILLGAVQTANPDVRLSLVESSDVLLLDASGKPAALAEDYTLEDPESGERTAQNLPLTYVVAGAYQPGEASLIIDGVWVERSSDASFTFDPGANPQPGQTWTLNKELQLGSHLVTIKDAALTPDGKGFTFSLENGEDLSNVALTDLEHAVLGGGGGGDGAGFTYRDSLPSGPITISVSFYSERIKGPWQAQVELPATNATPLPDSCLTQATWQEALLKSSRTLPTTDGSLMVLAGANAPDYLYRLYLADLESSTANALLLSDGGSLSPDQKTLVAATDEGLKFYDMVTGAVTPISGSDRRDREPIWSPDGSTIAYTRGPATGLIGAVGPHEVWLMDADGTNQRALVSDNQGNFAQAWTPDSKTLLYTSRIADGALLISIDPQTGEANLLTQFNYQNAGVAVSPDGKQMAYEAMLPGEKYGVYVSDLDGGNARLIANADPIVVTGPQWSPDGQWLAVTVYDTSINENSSSLALVNLTTCEITPMLDLNGHVVSWK